MRRDELVFKMRAEPAAAAVLSIRGSRILVSTKWPMWWRIWSRCPAARGCIRELLGELDSVSDIMFQLILLTLRTRAYQHR